MLWTALAVAGMCLIVAAAWLALGLAAGLAVAGAALCLIAWDGARPMRRDRD